MELNINMKSRNLAKMFCPQSKHIIQRTGSISPGEGRVFTGRYWGSDGGRWWSRRTCAHPPVRAPKLQLAAEQPSTGECWIPPKKDTPRLRSKKKPQKDGRRGEIAFRIKPHTCLRHLEGSNIPCAHQDPETPQRLNQTCV